MFRLKQEALLFLKKKKQKDFYQLGHGRWCRQSPRPSITKIFCALFFKKAPLAAFSP
jgi:hypothetical protein